MKNGERQRFFVSGICCATEETLLRKKLDGIAGSDAYQFRVLTGELILDRDVPADVVRSEIRKAGFGIRTSRDIREQQPFLERHRDGLLIGLAALLTGIGLAAEFLEGPGILSRTFLLAAIAVAGWNVFNKAWKAIRSFALDMNVLMSAAVLGALAIDQWAEGAVVLILFGFSLVLETYSLARTSRAVRSLMDTAPDETTVIRNGRPVVVPSAEVRVGEVMKIRPGERIALDGVVTEGSSGVNESAVTGESVPVRKEPGSRVFAGSLNERGALDVRTTRVYDDTLLAHMIHLVEAAEEKRAPVQLFVERFARIYTPLVFLLAVLTTVIPPLVLDEPFGIWFYRSLVLLVIACPCALVISTPVTIVSAITSGARRGILIKGGRQLETLSRVRSVVFDKTGTLTEGKPGVTDVIALNSAPRKEILRVAAALESRSEHPLAASLVAAAEREGIGYDDLRVEGFEAIPGAGVRATIGTTEYVVSSISYVRERGIRDGGAAALIGRLASEGKTGIVVSKEGVGLGVIGVRDRIRPEAGEALRSLTEGGIKQLLLLSGDDPGVVQPVAAELGLSRAEGGRLPAEKAAAVDALKADHGPVAMVGDGVNDAPALATASVGIAMGVSGSDAALDTADVVLLSDHLGRLPGLFELSRKAMRVVRQNIVLALAVKGVFLALSLTGAATLWMAILADDGAALAVILNGLRLLVPGSEKNGGGA